VFAGGTGGFPVWDWAMTGVIDDFLTQIPRARLGYAGCLGGRRNLASAAPAGLQRCLSCAGGPVWNCSGRPRGIRNPPAASSRCK
jgi:hypothetical protein